MAVSGRPAPQGCEPHPSPLCFVLSTNKLFYPIFDLNVGPDPSRDKKSKACTAVGRMCGLSTVVTPAGASLTMYLEIRSYANSIWDDNNNNNNNTSNLVTGSYTPNNFRLILISRFRYFRIKNSRMGLHFSDQDFDTSASSAAFFEVCNVL